MYRTFAAAGLLLVAVAVGARGQAGSETFGVPVFPGAKARPEVARAVEAFYRPGLPPARTLRVGVFETAATFDAVAGFYGPLMDPGSKAGWRRKTRPLQHHTSTLVFMRSNLARQRPETGEIAAVFRPLLGDPRLSAQAFEARTAELLRRYPGASIEAAEGVRTLASEPAGGQVMLLIERPYIDLERLRLVDRTRIQLVRVATGTAR